MTTRTRKAVQSQLRAADDYRRCDDYKALVLMMSDDPTLAPLLARTISQYKNTMPAGQGDSK